MPRRNRNSKKGGRARRSKGEGSGWMHSDRGKRGADRAPLTPGAMHSKTRRR